MLLGLELALGAKLGLEIALWGRCPAGGKYPTFTEDVGRGSRKGRRGRSWWIGMTEGV